jgi:hypothetical protein
LLLRMNFQFHAILRFIVQNVFQSVNHFQQSSFNQGIESETFSRSPIHSIQIQQFYIVNQIDWRNLNPLPLHLKFLWLMVNLVPSLINVSQREQWTFHLIWLSMYSDDEIWCSSFRWMLDGSIDFAIKYMVMLEITFWLLWNQFDFESCALLSGVAFRSHTSVSLWLYSK